MSKRYGLDGISENVELGEGKQRLRSLDGAVEIRNAADSDYAPLVVAPPTAPEHAATMEYVETSTAVDENLLVMQGVASGELFCLLCHIG